MDISTAAEILGIELPTKIQIAKKAFRNLAMFFHPDKGGDPDKFRDIKQAYQTIEDHPETLSVDSEVEILQRTVNGVELSTLGKGYNLQTSAKQCDNCEGVGFHILHEPRAVDCPSCNATGWKHVACSRCGGSGKGNAKMPICPQCKGSGSFVPHDMAVKKGMKPKSFGFNDLYGLFGTGRHWPDNHYCNNCGGTGNVLDQTGKKYAVTCSECKGIGEVKMWNPVLPRGLLTSKLGK